jgi:hypothetical protein
MQESYPKDMTSAQAELVGKLRREYFTDEAQMGTRRDQLRAQGEVVTPPVRKTVEELLARGNAILAQLSTEPDRGVRKALRNELTSLAYALSHPATN